MQDRHQRMLILGHIPDRSGKTYSVPFSKQLAVVFDRGVKLLLRDKSVLISTYVVEIIKVHIEGLSRYSDLQTVDW